jgi:NDP-sugar pyrophosphorylase family protein
MTGIFDDVTVVILAGGRGSRISAIHPERPKPMIPIAGRPFLTWLTAWLATQGPTHFVYSTGWLAEQIEAWCKNDEFPGLTRTCRRETEPLGTGGGLFNCLDLCRDWVLVANGDGLCMGGIQDLLQLRSEAGLGGGLLGVPVDDTSRFGSLSISSDGHLIAFREKIPGVGYINSGFYLFRTELLRSIKRPGVLSIERDLIPEMIASGKHLRALQLQETAFIDIGTPESLATAESFINAHLERRVRPPH